LGALLIAAESCSVSEQVKDKPSGKNASAEALENEAYTMMQYRLNFVDEAKLGGQDILFVRQASDIESPQQAQLQTALQKGNLPLHLKMRVYARNPSVTSVQLKQLDYKLLLDGKELTAGTTGLNTQLETSAIETLPINVDINVKPGQLNGSTPAAFAAGLTDFTAANRRLVVQIRPQYVGTSGRQMPASDFMPVDLVTKKKATAAK
jgi:LEA14-like dessication related protein